MIEVIDLTKDYETRFGSRRVLDSLCMTVAPGQKIGVLGRNGAGKSTLVKLIGGVETPTSGKVRRLMSVSWPLAFSGGFQGGLTGNDNIRFLSRIHGIPFKDIHAFVEDFSELGKHLRDPVKTYSSGMRARLTFALSLAIEFDCYLIDEVIAVGDSRFHSKCHDELFVKRADRALVLVSHDTNKIKEYCTSAILLDHGKAAYFDDLQAGLDAYVNSY